MPRVVVHFVLVVQAVVDEDGLDAGQTAAGPVVGRLDALLLDSSNDRLPGAPQPRTRASCLTARRWASAVVEACMASPWASVAMDMSGRRLAIAAFSSGWAGCR